MFKFSTSKAFSVLQAEACPSLFILLLKRFTYKKLWVVHLPAGLVHAKKLNSPQIYYDCKSSFSSCRYSEGYWNLPTFQVLLHKAEEFGSDHPMGCPRIPCREDIFLNLTSHFTVDNFVKNECNPMYILFSFLCNFFFFFFWERENIGYTTWENDRNYVVISFLFISPDELFLRDQNAIFSAIVIAPSI